MRPGKPPKVEEKLVTSFDGTQIAYHSIGEGPAILLGNGLGGSWKAWTHQIAYLGDRYRFVSWDYRGLYRSGPPTDRSAIRVEDHARDALVVLDDAGIDEAAVFGWSMGVQVALELYSRAPERMKAMVLINGVAGMPYESVLNAPAVGRMVPHALGLVRRVPNLAQRVTERVVRWPETVTWAKRVGIAAQTLDESVFTQLAESFAGLDMDLYLHILQLLGEHDARPVLDEVDVPLLVVTGDRDLMTPRVAAEEMVRRVPGAELLVVPGGTHYVCVEYPELVNLRIEKFFRERRYVPA